MTDLLLDTNALLWYLLQPAVLSGPAQRAIQAASGLAVSAGTVWEVATKYRIGKLPEAGPLVQRGLITVLAAQAVVVLPVTGPDAEWAGRHPAAHRDPFDRIIAAQAVLRGMSVVSADAQLDAFDARRVW